MPATGLFGLVCAACGDDLEVSDDGAAACRTCHQRYLARVGFLIPVGPAFRGSGPSAPVGGGS